MSILDYFVVFENVRVGTSNNGNPVLRKMSDGKTFWSGHNIVLSLGVKDSEEWKKNKKVLDNVRDEAKKFLKSSNEYDYTDFDLETQEGNIIKSPARLANFTRKDGTKSNEYQLNLEVTSFKPYENKHDKRLDYCRDKKDELYGTEGYAELFTMPGGDGEIQLTKITVAAPEVYYQGEENEMYKFPWGGDIVDAEIKFELKLKNDGITYILKPIVTIINIKKGDRTKKSKPAHQAGNRMNLSPKKTVKNEQPKMVKKEEPKDNSVDELDDLGSELDDLLD